MALRARTLIKRFPLPVYHRTIVPDTGSVWGGGGNPTMEVVTEVANFCTLQPVKHDQLSADLRGLNVNDIFVVRCEIPLYTSEDGTNFIGSGIYIPPSYFKTGGIFDPEGKGGYFNVTEVKPWNNGVVPHYECIIVKDRAPKVGNYPADKVTLTAEDMNTLEKFKAGNWITGWIS